MADNIDESEDATAINVYCIYGRSSTHYNVIALRDDQNSLPN